MNPKLQEAYKLVEEAENAYPFSDEVHAEHARILALDETEQIAAYNQYFADTVVAMHDVLSQGELRASGVMGVAVVFPQLDVSFEFGLESRHVRKSESVAVEGSFLSYPVRIKQRV